MQPFVSILIAVGAALGLCAICIVFVLWGREALDGVAALPPDPGRRLWVATRRALIPCLLVTYPALLAQQLALRFLPASYHGTWWGALLVAYGASWLLYYAALEREWRRRNPS